MARHVDPDDTSFGRTLARAALGGVLALVITAVVAAVVARTTAPAEPSPVVLAPPEVPTTPPPLVPPTEAGSPGLDVPGLSETGGAGPTEEPSEEIRVQVLDGVGDITRANDAADVLRELGYTVALTDSAAIAYEVTTVIYTEGHREDAEELTRRDDRFVAIEENDDLEADVDLHVVVGSDWPAD